MVLCGLYTGMLCMSAQNVAKEKKMPEPVWTKNANRGTGLYNTRNYFVAPGVSLSGSAF